MKKLHMCAIFLIVALGASAQKGKWIKGMYLQWGYNVDAYTKSNIHFKLANGDNFTLHYSLPHESCY